MTGAHSGSGDGLAPAAHSTSATFTREAVASWHGALLIDKPDGISSFGVIERLQRMLASPESGLKRRDLPKMGHGGTLDPFATGLLVVCVGRGVKLSRYFLGSQKAYSGDMKFGETTIPGDPTAEVSARSEKLPASLDELNEMARKLCLQPYQQTPPMHSAKKQGGRPLYELAREGKEVERESKLCKLENFRFASYEAPLAAFSLDCSSGTYIRTLSQDFAGWLGTVGMLQSLRRTRSGSFRLEQALKLDAIGNSTATGKAWPELSAWIPFDRLLDGFPSVEATEEEAVALQQGRQAVLLTIVGRAPLSEALESQNAQLTIRTSGKLVAVARRDETGWGLERVFSASSAVND